MTAPLLWRVDSRINGIDPRARLLGGFLICVLIAISRSPYTVAWGVVLGLVAAMNARLPWRGLWARWVGVNLFMAMIVLVLPWSVPGAVWFRVGPLEYSREGFFLALLVAGKANAILFFVSAWISTIDVSALGHALEHLRMPTRLAHIFLFTVRYLDVLQREQRRLIRAARARGFSTRMNLHTYRTVAQLVSVLLHRGLARSERVLKAMKARGYAGHFYMLHHFAWRRSDSVFACVVAVLMGTLCWLEWIV